MVDFQSLIKEYESEKTPVIACSVDPVEKAREAVEKLGITYPVGYGLDAEEISKLTGAFYEADKKFLHATGFLIRPDNRIEIASYSSGPIGRFVAQDVLNVVKFYKSKK